MRWREDNQPEVRVAPNMTIKKGDKNGKHPGFTATTNVKNNTKLPDNGALSEY